LVFILKRANTTKTGYSTKLSKHSLLQRERVLKINDNNKDNLEDRIDVLDDITNEDGGLDKFIITSILDLGS